MPRIDPVFAAYTVTEPPTPAKDRRRLLYLTAGGFYTIIQRIVSQGGESLSRSFAYYAGGAAAEEKGVRIVNNKEMVVTPEGLKALEDELEELKTVKRMEVAEKIKVARGFGDLSENSEYDEAKNEQGLIESRIIFLEKMLKNVRVLDHSELNNETVMVGCRVKVRDEDGEEEEYSIVGSTEADPMEGKISDESAVGKGLIGKRVGEIAEITVPSGAVVRYEVLEISTGN